MLVLKLLWPAHLLSFPWQEPSPAPCFELWSRVQLVVAVAPERPAGGWVRNRGDRYSRSRWRDSRCCSSRRFGMCIGQADSWRKPLQRFGCDKDRGQPQAPLHSRTPLFLCPWILVTPIQTLLETHARVSGSFFFFFCLLR